MQTLHTYRIIFCKPRQELGVFDSNMWYNPAAVNIGLRATCTGIHLLFQKGFEDWWVALRSRTTKWAPDFTIRAYDSMFCEWSTCDPFLPFRVHMLTLVKNVRETDIPGIFCWSKIHSLISVPKKRIWLLIHVDCHDCSNLSSHIRSFSSDYMLNFSFPRTFSAASISPQTCRTSKLVQCNTYHGKLNLFYIVFCGLL